MIPKFKDGAVAIIRGKAWNLVAGFLNNLVGGNYINIRKPAVPSSNNPVVVDVDNVGLAPAVAHEFHAQGLWANEPQENEADTKTKGADYDISTDALLAAKAPKYTDADTDEPADGKDDNETDAQKIARIGTSERAAREDHKHLIGYDQCKKIIQLADTSTPTVISGDPLKSVSYPNASYTWKDDEWNRSTDSDATGVTVRVFTRTWENTLKGVYFCFRELTFDEFGRLKKISGEKAMTLVKY